MHLKQFFCIALVCVCTLSAGCASTPQSTPAISAVSGQAGGASSIAGAEAPKTSEAPAAPDAPADLCARYALFGNTPNLACVSIEDLAAGALKGQKDNFGQELYDADFFRTEIESGHVLEGLGSSYNSFGINFTIEDVWYETTTANMKDNFYSLSSDHLDDPIYIFMTVTAKNTLEQEAPFYLNGGTIIVFPKGYMSQSAEFTYQDQVVSPIANNHNYALCSLPAGASNTYTIVYRAGAGFLTYDPIYLQSQCFPADMLLSTSGMSEMAHKIWIKLPPLEKR